VSGWALFSIVSLRRMVSERAFSTRYVFSTQRGVVAQICNLPYRRFVIGRTSESSNALALADRLQNAILRYSRLQICATLNSSATGSVKLSVRVRIREFKTRAPRGFLAHAVAPRTFEPEGVLSAYKRDSSVGSDIFIAKASENDIKPHRGGIFVVASPTLRKRIEAIAPMGLLMISRNEGYKYSAPDGANSGRCWFSRRTA
jgi:hypothetical protein